MIHSKTFYVLLAILSLSISSRAQWQPAGERIRTPWAEQVDPGKVLDEYPRPLMVRSDWKNLNGLWDYAITSLNSSIPSNYEGKILVPFPVESSLSGVKRKVGEDSLLWYNRTFTVPKEWRGQRILLHFGAVDWKTDVWINDVKVGGHQGGYTTFSFDITPYLNRTGVETLTVRVWDPTDNGPQPRGKQVSNPRGIFYTAVTGIWQTVWLEPLPETFIDNLRTTPDLDHNRITVAADVTKVQDGDLLEITVRDQGRAVTSGKAAVTVPAELFINDPKLWTPDTPHLYDIEVSLLRNGKVIDNVSSYFAMRKISTSRDENGHVRLQLNNKDLFHFGLLDQGWWPDGLYTAPTDEALKYDIQVTKDLGFNMIRKHVKVEPPRWYYHADRLGVLVWQDMPSGDKSLVWQGRQFFEGTEFKRSAESEAIYRKELKAIMDQLHSHPSVVVWVPFNENWGQFKTEEVASWTKSHDPSRLVIPASGGNHFQTGDILSIHSYPRPSQFLMDWQRANVQGEFGGIGRVIEGHLWEPDRNWGYVQLSTSEAATDLYVEYIQTLKKLIGTGFSGAVYTQTTDVEVEVNGMMTYDRKVIKMDIDRVREANRQIVRYFD
jgi:beta-galactosidase/beta-glucuronidase